MSTKKLNQDTFLQKCKKIHGEKFDYSNTIYKDSLTKITVRCRSCNNEWSVTPGNHTGPRKSGCPVCKISNQVKRNTESSLSQTEFITRCKNAHGNNFDYSETRYVNSNTKVRIKCYIHGEFEQWPQDHMRGIGCPVCSGVKKKSTEEFVAEAKKIFPEFDYSLVNYHNAHAKVEIICPTHGIFKQKPNAILNGVGCKECSVNRALETKIKNGTISNPEDRTDYENYRKKVWRISNRNYKLHKEKINPENLPRSIKYHLDHIYPIQKGWINGKSAEEIGDWRNLQILEAAKNRKKGSKIL